LPEQQNSRVGWQQQQSAAASVVSAAAPVQLQTSSSTSQLISMGAPGKRKVGGNSKTRKWHKQLLRGKFEERHVDQVWEDIRNPPQLVHNSKTGPLGTTAK
jgi:hypothetical protein